MSREMGYIGMKPCGKPHPECGDDEMFIMNATPKEFGEVGWETKRQGEVALTLEGELVPDRKPVFAKIEELKRKHPGFERVS